MIDKRPDFVLSGGTIVSPAGVENCDIALAGGRIAAIGDLAGLPAENVIDCRGLTVLPGVIDSHVHFREPGLTEHEDLESGSRSAVLGGVTTVFEMPNTIPPTTNKALLADKVARAHHHMHCDFAFFVGATHDNIAELPELERMPGCAGVKVLMGTSSGTLLVEDDDSIRKILRTVRRRVAFHSEDEYRLRARVGECVEGDVKSHSVWRDEVCAMLATRRLIALAHETGQRVHIVHVTTAEEIEFLAAHKDIASVEATPHHLTFAAPECYDRLGTLVQINPPIRDATHRAMLWRGLAQGVVDIVGSDHSPQTLDAKTKPYPASAPGIPGVQTLVPLMLDSVNAGRLSLMRFADLTSAGPARLYNIARKGRIAVGYDADLTIVDLKREETITNSWIASRIGWTPYDGMRVKGWPVGTFLRGRRVVWQGELLAPGQGEAVQFLDALRNYHNLAVDF